MELLKSNFLKELTKFFPQKEFELKKYVENFD
jgi:hypothetical protein